MSSTGRRRSNIRQYSAEGEALNQISKEAEDRLAAKRAARAEAREIRQREIERKMKEQEMAEGNGEPPADVTPKAGRHAGRPSRNNAMKNYRDEEPEDVPVRDKDRDFKNEFRELEEKYKGAMFSLAQLDNERTALNYSVDLLKEELEEREEGSLELQRQLKEKTRDLDFARRDFRDCERQLAQVKEVLAYQEKVMEESGFMIVRDEEGKMVIEKTSTIHNGPINNAVLLTSETLGLLQKEEGTLDTKIRNLALDRAKHKEEARKLKEQLAEQQHVKKDDSGHKIPTANGPEMQLYEIQREASKTIHEYKIKLQKAEQDIATLEGSVGRLETQVKRYKSEAERAEGVEDELKTEKRKLQRELRDAQTLAEELQNQNRHLNKRLDKIKQARNALAAQ